MERDKADLKWRTTHPERYRGKELVRYGVRSGRIKKPNVCSICGTKFNEARKINGHHINYLEPLNVIWCCDNCHKKIHKNIFTCEYLQTLISYYEPLNSIDNVCGLC